MTFCLDDWWGCLDDERPKNPMPHVHLHLCFVTHEGRVYYSVCVTSFHKKIIKISLEDKYKFT